MHHEQDMRFYGGLKKEIPFTFWVMVAGTLAITGVGLGPIGFAGFWSKDAILESAWASGSVAGTIAFVLGALAALLTSFYSWRLIFLTFFGPAALGRIGECPARAPWRSRFARRGTWRQRSRHGSATGRDGRIPSARKPALDADPDRLARARRGACGPDLARPLRRRRARAGILAQQRRLQPASRPRRAWSRACGSS